VMAVRPGPRLDEFGSVLAASCLNQGGNRGRGPLHMTNANERHHLDGNAQRCLLKTTRLFVVSDLHLGGRKPAMMSHPQELASPPHQEFLPGAVRSLDVSVWCRAQAISDRLVSRGDKMLDTPSPCIDEQERLSDCLLTGRADGEHPRSRGTLMRMAPQLLAKLAYMSLIGCAHPRLSCGPVVEAPPWTQQRRRGSGSTDWSGVRPAPEDPRRGLSFRPRGPAGVLRWLRDARKAL
jgi:hypothetical protein